jgi:hypothetical protein
VKRRRAIPADVRDRADEAIAKYIEFHRLDPRRIGAFPDTFTIPARVYRAGRSKWVTYESAKVDPETLRRPRTPVSYIHEHDAGVTTYLTTPTDADADGVDVPARFRDVPALARLGFCLGFCFEDGDGRKQEAQATRPYPDLYTVPDGKCLLVIQSRRTVLALMWGGSLGVFARGIDG